MGLIGRLLVGLCAGHGRSQREDVVGVCVHQKAVVVRRRLLLAAVMRLWRRGSARALATARWAVDGPLRSPLTRPGAGGDPARVALRRPSERGEGVRQDGQHMMHPGGGLGVAQLQWHAMPRLEGMSLRQDEHEQALVFQRWQGAWGPTTALTVAQRALQGLVRRIQHRLGGRNRREQTCKRCVRPSGRGEQLSRSVWSGGVGEHAVIIHYSR